MDRDDVLNMMYMPIVSLMCGLDARDGPWIVPGSIGNGHHRNRGHSDIVSDQRSGFAADLESVETVYFAEKHHAFVP